MFTSHPRRRGVVDRTEEISVCYIFSLFFVARPMLDEGLVKQDGASCTLAKYVIVVDCGICNYVGDLGCR